MFVRQMIRILVVMIVLVSGRVWAQGGSNGIITGIVTDNSGAVVAGATVRIANIETGVVETLKTTGSGDYSSPPLHPGQYQVTVTVDGFQVSKNNLLLTVDQRARVDISLKTGSTSDTVTVDTSSAQLTTDTSEISTTITSKQVLDLPINNRNFVSLLFLTAGTVQTGGESGGSNGSQGSAKGNGAISINGNRSSSNQYLIDGMYNNDTVYQTPAISPSIDAVQEFKTQSGAYSAEFGGSANQVNISFRSGTNSYHGTAFDFLRNDAFDAKSRFDSASAKKPLLRQNQFGYTLGGPISIPKLYNGRDRTFFFANYEGVRIHQTAQVKTIVPTQAELGIGTPDGSAIIPQSAVDGGVCTGSDTCDNTHLLNPLAGYSRFAQDAAGNYIIPDSAISNYAHVVRTHIPVPNANLVLTPGNLPINYVGSLATPITGNQQNYRFDQTFNSKDSLYFRYSRAEFIVTSGGVGLLPEGQDLAPSEQTSYVGQYTHIFNSSIVNQGRFGYLKSYNAVVGVAGDPTQIAALNFSGLYKLSSTPFVETTFGNNKGQLSNFGGAANNDPEIFDQPTYDYSDVLTINRGSHTLSVGGDFRTLTLNDGGNANLGLITFDGQFSNSHIGDLLLGTYQTAQGSSPTPYSTPNEAGTVVHIKHNFLGVFAKDDWKATKRLTLNYGVRYDFNSAPYNKNLHYGYFDPTGNGLLDVADPKLISSGIGGSVYKYAGGQTAYAAQKLTFAPRFGLSYLVNKDTVIRAGFGIYFDSSEDSETRQFAEFYPYSVRQNLVFARDYNNPAAGIGQADALYPAITTIAPVSSANLGFLLTQSNVKKNPYVESYNLSVERTLGSKSKVEFDYVGNVGRHLEGRNNVNQPFPYDPANPTSVASRTPFSNFGQTIIVDSFSYPSNYNAFNAIAQTQQHGATLLAVYTWSKSLDLKSASAGVDGDSAGWVAAQNPHDEAAEYGRSGYDVGQRLVVSLVDELPVGRGKALDLHNKVANAVFGGFQVNAIATFQGGFPFSVNASDNSGLNGPVYAERANVSGNPILPRNQRDASHWFNTSVFSQPAPGTYGNSGRNLIRGPGINNWDISAFRNVTLFDRYVTQFRVESFNSLNHVQLSGPDSNVNDANFGKIQGTRIPGRIVQLGAKFIF